MLSSAIGFLKTLFAIFSAFFIRKSGVDSAKVKAHEVNEKKQSEARIIRDNVINSDDYRNKLRGKYKK